MILSEMGTMVVYFTQNSTDVVNINVDCFNYYYNGENLMVPPQTCVVCIPCNNSQVGHRHNVRDCVLLTFDRGWDHVQASDFVTIYVLDNDTDDDTLSLESGEILSSFLIYNQELFGVPVDKCVMGTSPYLDDAMDGDDDGYISSASV